ncbi:lipase family protein [Brenneria populi]|uniref:Lipase family protein n=1 Tax=Brenneria populi TaxID=1505588 RepID=A0ABU6JQR1_9GAMM|nr:lipase family protein [Brenneria populi Li et al. 2015]
MAIAPGELKRRHVIEICPFRAWVLALHDTKTYDLANGLNLGIMADLVYSAEKENKNIDYFFREKCQDLSSIPQFAEFPSYFHTLAVDVPFRDRYLAPVYLSTKDSEQPQGDTRLFTVECGTHVLVAWCGTDSLLNVLTDLSFGPKRYLPELGGEGNIHGGFLEAYELAKRKFGDELDAVKTALGKRKKLFICGHSLGGALALLYAAEMKSSQPVLYTYGMPRTFTRAAMPLLDGITHYRHVNDNDSITQIPPDADLDNVFYEKWGTLGDKLGFDWSLTTAAGLGVAVRDLTFQSAGFAEKKDPYWHHGNTVAFLRAQQCVISKKSTYNPSDPFPVTMSYVNQQAVKLFLVPSLNDECLKSTGEHQEAFIQCLSPGSLKKTFPQNTNPVQKGLASNPRNHSMAHRYLPYIHNQVLELASPERPMKRKAMRELFLEEIEKGNLCSGNPDEVQRNREFLALQDMLPVTLQRMQAEDTGKNALIRFAAVTEEEIELPN